MLNWNEFIHASMKQPDPYSTARFRIKSVVCARNRNWVSFTTAEFCYSLINFLICCTSTIAWSCWRKNPSTTNTITRRNSNFVEIKSFWRSDSSTLTLFQHSTNMKLWCPQNLNSVQTSWVPMLALYLTLTLCVSYTSSSPVYSIPCIDYPDCPQIPLERVSINVNYCIVMLLDW